MRLPTPLFAAATLTVATLFAMVGGCSATPESSRTVDQSVLPAAAKSLLVNNAVIDHVDEQRFAKGTVIYKIFYRVDGGKMQTIAYNSKTQTTPTGVFEEPIR